MYKGEETSHQMLLQCNTEYRFRVCVCRRCQDSSQDLCGPLSPPSLFTPRRPEPTLPGDTAAALVVAPTGIISTDERFATVIVCAFAAFSILIAFILQYFFMK